MLVLYICESNNAYLSTSLTHVRLLASVNSHVYSQGRALNELLATIWVFTDVGTDTTVYAFWKIVRSAHRKE